MPSIPVLQGWGPPKGSVLRAPPLLTWRLREVSGLGFRVQDLRQRFAADLESEFPGFRFLSG